MEATGAADWPLATMCGGSRSHDRKYAYTASSTRPPTPPVARGWRVDGRAGAGEQRAFVAGEHGHGQRPLVRRGLLAKVSHAVAQALQLESQQQQAGEEREQPVARLRTKDAARHRATLEGRAAPRNLP